MKRNPVLDGPVTIRNNGSSKVVPPYSKDRLKEIIRQGKERPRALTHDEATRAIRNRRVFRERLLAVEIWARGHWTGGYRRQ